MPKPIALQLYSLREQAKEDLAGVLKTVADIGYVGVETAGLYGHPAAEVKKMLDDVGLVACSSHAPAVNPEKTDEVIADCEALGHKDVGCGFGAKQFETEDQVKQSAEQFNQAVERLAPAGIRLHYHNHWWEYDAPNKGELLLELCPKVCPQFDIYWVATGGADPAKLIEKYADRSILIHVKDGPCVQEEAMTAVGKGKVDVKAALAAAEKAAAEWYIVELDRCDTDMVEAVRGSYAYLIDSGLAKGNK